MQPAHDHAQFRKMPEVVLETPVDGELVLLHLPSGNFHGLSEVGLAIWQALDRTSDIGRIKADLCRRYDVAPEVCAAQVDDFVDDLLGAGLLLRL